MQVQEIDIDTGKIKGQRICKKKYKIKFLGGPTTPTNSKCTAPPQKLSQRNKNIKVTTLISKYSKKPSKKLFKLEFKISLPKKLKFYYLKKKKYLGCQVTKFF